MPIAKANGTANNADSAASTSVFGRRSEMMSATGLFATMEVPGSPAKRLVSQRT
jgi:hypothetical protein